MSGEIGISGRLPATVKVTLVAAPSLSAVMFRFSSVTPSVSLRIGVAPARFSSHQIGLP